LDYSTTNCALELVLHSGRHDILFLSTQHNFKWNCMYYHTIMNNEQPTIRDYYYIICNLYTTARVTTQSITSQKTCRSKRKNNWW